MNERVAQGEPLPLLAYQEFGAETPPKQPPIIIAHGLYGSGRNWASIARNLAAQGHHLIVPDMRNHGQSFHHPRHDYPAMAEDLARLIDSFGGKADVIGHSMGGKAAMALALACPEKVRRLAVIDIAPVAYGHSQMPVIEALKSVDLGRVRLRRDADRQLAERIDDPALRAFLLHALDLRGDEPRWRLDLDALAANMDAIMGFPYRPGESHATFAGPTLFLRGENSDYVLPEHEGWIRTLFPHATIETITGAGHWLHAEKPREALEALRTFLDRPGTGHPPPLSQG